MAGETGAKGKKADWTDWHAAFFDAIRAEFASYKDVLEFRSQHELSAGPLRIDVLVIKKEPGAVIDKNIGRIFRQINIVEYKRPDESLAVGDFYKVLEYVCGYQALQEEAPKGSEATKITDMTASFVVRKYPRTVIGHLRDVLGYGVAEKAPGVYEITGGIVPMQVVEAKKLPEDENLWLQKLTDDLSFEGLREVLRRTNAEAAVVGKMGAYLYALLKANSIVTGEGVKMLSAEFIEAVESTGLGQKWREEGVKEGIEKGIEKGKLEDARAMFLEGIGFDIIERITKIPMKRLKKELLPQ